MSQNNTTNPLEKLQIPSLDKNLHQRIYEKSLTLPQATQTQHFWHNSLLQTAMMILPIIFIVFLFNEPKQNTTNSTLNISSIYTNIPSKSNSTVNYLSDNDDPIVQMEDNFMPSELELDQEEWNDFIYL